MAKIALSGDILEDLKRERARTGLGVKGLLRAIEGCGMPGCTIPENRLRNILGGLVQTIEEEEHRAIMDAFRAAPDDDTVPLSDAHIETIKHYLAQGHRLSRALQYDRANRPEGLSRDLVMRWVKGKAKTARKPQLDYVLGSCRAILEAPTIRQDDVDELKKLIDVTGHGPVQICRDIPDFGPTALKTLLAKGADAHIDPEIVETLLQRYRTVVRSKNYCVSLAPYKNRLLEEKDRTGLSPAHLLRKDGSLCGITASTLARWLRGTVETAPLSAIEKVLAAYQNQPDAPAQTKPKQTAYAATPATPGENTKKTTIRALYQPIPEDKLRALKHYKNMGLLPSAIYKAIPYKKEYPRFNMINSWVSETVKTAIPDDVDMVLQLCERYLQEIGNDHKIYRG